MSRPTSNGNWNGGWAKLPEAMREPLRKLAHTPKKERTSSQKKLAKEHEDLLKIPNADGEWHQIAEAFPEVKESAGSINNRMKGLKAELIPVPRIRAVFDMGGEPSRTYLLQRGDAQALGQRVEPGVPRMLSASLAPYEPVPSRDGRAATGWRSPAG